MDSGEREATLARLRTAFSAAEDVTLGEGQPLHVLLPEVELPDPWSPSPTRALVVFASWPDVRPLFFIDEAVVGSTGAPPRSNSCQYVLGEPWRAFSFAFSWAGNDPVRAVQLWINRFAEAT
jgi:hypothetical protein